MATTTETVKGLSKVEMKLLNDFTNTDNAREFSAGVNISKLNLSYSEDGGFTIELVETPVPVVTATA